MRRVQLVTEEMRQRAEFTMAGRDIDAAIAKGPRGGAKRRIIALMKKLLEHPSEETVSYFAEIQERWGPVVDAFAYLERRWGEWVHFDDALEVIAYKHKEDPVTTDLIDLIGTTTLEISLSRPTLGLGYRVGILVQTILERCSHNDRLSNELITLLLRSDYSDLTNIRAYVERFNRTRQLNSPPASREQ